jgi:hypothetical protein
MVQFRSEDLAGLGLGLATILAGKELKETMVMVTVTFCSRDLVIGDWLVVTDRIQSRPETSTKVLTLLERISLLSSNEYLEPQYIIQ